jgi:hypothetical protein
MTSMFRHWNDAPELIVDMNFDVGAFLNCEPGRVVLCDPREFAFSVIPSYGNYDYIAGMVSENE